MGPARVLLQERERKGDDLWLLDGDQLVRCSSAHLRPVSTAEQTLCSLRDGEARTFQQLVQELPKRNFVDLVGQSSPVEEDFEEPMDVASSDNELHEDFLSGNEFASTPNDSKDPQMSYQTRSTPSHAEAPGTMSPEFTEAPFISKVEQSSFTARPSVAQTPVDLHSTSQTSAIPPTASPSHMELSPEPMSQSRAMKRPLEQIPQPESKRMSLGEDPSVEHGILAAEDLRWLPKQRSREVRYPQTCWNPDETEKRKPVLTSCAQDEVVEVAFALSHHEAIKIAETPATALAALARQGRGEVRVSTLTPQEREELVQCETKRNQQFPQRCSSGGGLRDSGLQCKSLMRMRWVITRKSDDSLKARLVIQGFTDPQLGAKPTASPTVSRRGRQLFLTVAGSLGMKVFKGDAKTAFLQGSVGDQELHCEPIAELAQALGLEHHQCVRLRKSVCGSTDAPGAWWERVETDMNELGWRTLTTEPCFWVMTSVSGRIEGLAVAYVDDFMVAIHEESPVGQRHLSEVKALYEWGEWESGSFYPMWCADRATSASESLGWFFSVLCALRGIDGSSGLVISETKTA